MSSAPMDSGVQEFFSFSIAHLSFAVILISCIVIIVTSSAQQAGPEEEEDVGNKKEKVVTGYRPPLMGMVKPTYLWAQFKLIFKNPIKRFLSNFVGAFYIINYRHEWGKYRKYDVDEYKLRPKLRCKRHDHQTTLWSNLVKWFSTTKKELEEQKEFQICRKKKKPKKHEDDMHLDHNHNGCELITINISGLKFVTQLRTLNHFPETLLGNETLRAAFYDSETREYFFDRNRLSFEGVMYYYQSGGILRKPHGVPQDIFTIELTYFQMKDTLQKSKKVDPDASIVLPHNLLTRKLWLLFEYPESSPQAQIVAILSISAVGISIFTFCAITLPVLPFTATDDIFAKKKTEDESIFDEKIRPFFMLDTICICWFVFELLMRILCCPNLKDFFTDFMNIVDMVAILPYILSLIFHNDSNKMNSGPEDEETEGRGRAATVLKVARLVRVFKLSRHSAGLKVLGSTLKASMKELSLLILFLMIGVVFFSSIIYFAEEFEPTSSFHSIPDGFWWSIITMTTVGYGDIVPVGVYGKIVGACCSLVGVLTLALPVPIVGSNFEFFYHARSTAKKRVDYVYVDNCPNRSRDYAADRLEKQNLGRRSDDSDSDFVMI